MSYKYDFTTVMDRRGWDALAVESLGKGLGSAPGLPDPGYDAIPMWVADMNFPTVPTIPEAIIKRVGHPAYGYFEPRQEYFDKIISWQERRNGVAGLKAEHIGYENGVLGGVLSAVRTFAAPGSEILVHSPTYIGFTHSVENAGYKLCHSQLTIDEDGIYRMDYEDMEEKLRFHRIHTAILCSPHNPCGRVWERWELERAVDIFRKYDVNVISDEIWSDLILEGHKHIPTQMISEDARQRTVALYAPSKTFNLAGLIGSYHIIYNDAIRERFLRESALSHYNDMNVLSMHALMGAYTPEGEQWLEELRQVLTGNVNYAREFIESHFPGIKCSRPEGTYMLFIDCTEFCEAHGCSLDDVLHAAWKVGVAVQDGRPFHGPCHIRMNVALPFSRVEEAMERLKQIYRQYITDK